MRVIAKSEGDFLAKGVAEHVCKCKADHRVIVADKPVDTKEEACQSAKSYWMMGWTWDEIETVLEDAEYPKDTISYAIKETKSYARKILNEGPFSIMKSGQGVKLVNGELGTLADIHADHITVVLGGALGKVKIADKQIDMEATKQLVQAFDLRVKAAESLDKLLSNADRVISIAECQLEKIQATKALTGFLADVDGIINQLISFRQDNEEAMRSTGSVHTMLKASHGIWESRPEKEFEFSQYAFAILTEESSINDKMARIVHGKLGNALSRLYNNLVEFDPKDKPAVVDSLNRNFSEIAGTIDSFVQSIKNSGSYIYHYTKLMAGKHTTDTVDVAVDWAKLAWTRTQEIDAKFELEVVPWIDKFSADVDAYVAETTKHATSVKVASIISNEGA